MDIMKRSQIVALLSTGLAVVGITGCAMLPGNRDERSAGRCRFSCLCRHDSVAAHRGRAPGAIPGPVPFECGRPPSMAIASRVTRSI